jgi:hypothetical protein
MSVREKYIKIILRTKKKSKITTKVEGFVSLMAILFVCLGGGSHKFQDRLGVWVYIPTDQDFPFCPNTHLALSS